MSTGALRRFDRLLKIAVHGSTPIEEARTALEGARRVAAGHDIPRSEQRLHSAETVLGFRIASVGTASVGDAMRSFSEAAERAAERARGAFEIVRDKDGTYRREYR